jgi:hypothetical protein
MFILCAVALATATAWAAGAGKMKGGIMVSDQDLPPTADQNKFLDALGKWNRSEISKPKDADTWSIHVVAFPDKKPETTSVTLLVFDVTDGKKDYLTRKDISCDPKADILVADVDISTDDGVKAGHTIQLVLARLVGESEIDLAKTGKIVFK